MIALHASLGDAAASVRRSIRIDSGNSWLAESSFEDLSTFRDPLSSGGHGPEMVVIPAGSFRMGCLVDDGDCAPIEFPVHEVDVPQFAVSKYEVTFAEWDACVDAGACDGYRPSDIGWGRDDRPVMNVSWVDAETYARWLSEQSGAEYRLPSEAEWEYAARAGTRTKYHWGNELGVNRANCGDCGSQWSDRQTAPVGSFEPNAWALHDMHGNVWEWTRDCGNSSYAGAPADGTAWTSGDCSARMGRGNSWAHDGRRRPPRAALRDTIPLGRAINVGFRVARTLAR